MSGDKYSKESESSSYRHEFHAGNVGDVWKHIALCCVLRSLQHHSAPLTLLDCHAGMGHYRLEGAGEWKEGIDRLLRNLKEDEAGACIEEYLQAVQAAGFSTSRRYPGSPELLKGFRRPGDKLVCCELDESAAAALHAAVVDAEVLNEDGLQYLRNLAQSAAPFFALVDPPWVMKQDWKLVPDAVAQAWCSSPGACLMMWYPIKSYTRVAAMHKQLAQAGLPYQALEVITTPLEYQRKRLNGSGVILVNAASQVIGELAAAAAVVARACAIFEGRWQVKVASNGSEGR